MYQERRRIPQWKILIQLNCESRNDYHISNTVTRYENQLSATVYANKYNKWSWRWKSKSAMVKLCMRTNPVYKCTVHTKAILYVYMAQRVNTIKNCYHYYVVTSKKIKKRHSTFWPILWREVKKIKLSIRLCSP